MFSLCLITILVFGPALAVGGDISQSLKVPPADMLQMLSLEDGSSLVGKITHVGESEITFETSVGEMTIIIDKIREIKLIPSSSIKDGKYWFPNPNRTRMYITPTGRMLRSGEGYFSDSYIFFPGFAYGITDNITIGGGFSLFPGLGFNEQLLYFTPKVGVAAGGKVDLAASAMIVRIPDPDEDDSIIDEDEIFVGLLFGTGTIGTADKSFTFGLGWGFVEDETSDPAVLLGGEYRLSRRTSFVSENWVFPGVDEPLVSYGIRFFGEQMAVDLALFNILGEDAIFPGVPYVGFVYNF
jgi:hypothetical protein